MTRSLAAPARPRGTYFQDELAHVSLAHVASSHELLDHVAFDHDLPLHDAPDQVQDDQDLPLQSLPDHDLPLHEDPDQDLPLQSLPDHDLPFHVPLDHDLPAASSCAMEAEPKGELMMSFSPDSVTPSLTTWADPRDPSSVPVPEDGVDLLTYAGTLALNAAVRLSSPEPCV